MPSDPFQSGDDGWVIGDIEVPNMKKINVYYFYSLAREMNRFHRLPPDTEWLDVVIGATMLKRQLTPLVEKSEPVAIHTCLPEAQSLLAGLEGLIESKVAIIPIQLADVQNAAYKFETTLETELRDLETYFVLPIGIYSTTALLTKAEEMFGENKELLPAITVKQIQEAGKCLAFSLGSAAAFHLFAALESVLRVYYDVLSNGARPPANPSMGAYIGELSELPKVNNKLLAALRQVKDLHRNPTIHFETLLSSGEALTLVGMIHSAIATTLQVVSKLPSKTAR